MRIRRGNVTGAQESRLLGDYFDFREASFPPGKAYVRTPPNEADYRDDSGCFLVVEDDDGLLVGCGGLRMIDGPEGRARAEIKHVWLLPAARGRGLAGRLLDELESVAKERGVQELVLDTHHSLTDAARLYERHGFSTISPYNRNPNATRWYGKAL